MEGEPSLASSMKFGYSEPMFADSPVTAPSARSIRALAGLTYGVFARALGLALALAAGFILMAPSGAGAQETLSFALDIRNGRVAPENRTIRVKEGDKVDLRWTADRPLELHLHGYDIEIRVAPGVQRTMSVDAHTAGRFPVEIHGKVSHGNIVYLEVHPR